MLVFGIGYRRKVVNSLEQKIVNENVFETMQAEHYPLGLRDSHDVEESSEDRSYDY